VIACGSIASSVGVDFGVHSARYAGHYVSAEETFEERLYEDDPAWYDASNFKNSLRKLCEFHTANPTWPGPPERLYVWVRCWEEDRDAGDHSDDNKPQRSYTGRGRLRIRVSRHCMET
jgi:hypothetical protein